MATFKEFVDQSWAAPKSEAKKIVEDFKNNFSQMNSEDDVMLMAELIVHICGECTGEWQKGIELLKKLKNNAPIKDKAEMKRLVAVLNLGNNPNISIEEFSKEDQIIIYMKTATALKSLGGLKNAEKLINKADALKD